MMWDVKDHNYQYQYMKYMKRTKTVVMTLSKNKQYKTIMKIIANIHNYQQ